MKTSVIFSSGVARLARLAWLSWMLTMAMSSFASGLTDGSFVNGLLTVGSRSVDIQVDNSVGTTQSGKTYLLGRDDSANAYLTILDQSGAQIATNVISGITPAGMAVVPGTNAVYLVGGSKVFLVNATNGAIIAQTNLLPNASGLSLKSVYWDSVSNLLYVCGNYSGAATTDAFGRTLKARGQQAAVVFSLARNLSSELGMTTFGCDDSFAANSADSVVVDESGDVFVAGHFGGGNFKSDYLNSGLFNYVQNTTASVGNVQNVIDNVASPNASGTVSTIDFPTSTAPDSRRYDGYVFAPVTGDYVFYNKSDDGARLLIDGKIIIDDNASHPALTTAHTNTLVAGLHKLQYFYFNGGGPGEGHVKWILPNAGVSGYDNATFIPAANLGANEGYVLKLSAGLNQIQGFYSSTVAAGQGGEINELAYKSGFVYGIGYWQGQVDTNMTGVADSSTAGSKNIEIIKLDTDLKLKKRATVKNTHDINGYGITADDSGNIYVTGSHGPASSDLFGSSDPATQPSKSISAAQSSIFMAQLNASLNFQWVQTPADPQASFDFVNSPPRARWSTALQRAYWFGYLVGGSLTMGNPSTMRTVSDGNEGFLALLEPGGQFAEQVLLTLYSDYGSVSPWGGYNNPAFLDGFNRRLVIKGSQVAASVPSVIYLDLAANNVADDSSDQAETRITCTGYTVGENVANGTANNYTFTVAQDTVVRFNFTKEYALRIESDLSDTTRADWAGVGLASYASGSPNPTVQKHWVKSGDPVIASVDSSVDDQNFLSQGLNVRYAVDSYRAYGPARSDYISVSGAITNRYAFTGNDVRWQIPQFIMSGPAGIKYHWKIKLGVQVVTTGLKSASYPHVQVISDLGGLPSSQPDGAGSGTFYFDYGTVLNIGSILNQGTTQLQGWLDGDGTIFTGTGSLGDLNGSFSLGSTNYSALQVSLTRPARVIWNYGDRIFDETVTLGNTVTFSTVDDPAIAGSLQKYLPPASVQVVSGPQGSSANEMAIWDDVGKKYYPLRPGVVMSYWQTTDTDTNARVIVRLTFQYPASPHYRHIANTRGVTLNVSNSPISFVNLKYTESSTGAAVDSQTNFTATGPGRTVLLFNETSSSGRSGKIVTPRVRVVQTMNWSDNLPATQTAVIGKKITSVYDTAGLGTGYLFSPNARYNASIYDRNKLTGPIIPVNLNPTAGANDQLVVVWYENRDQILWPYQAIRYQSAWPTNAAQGLNRIVIASRYGNESVAADGTDQNVVPAETYGTNTYPAEKTFNPARFSSVKLYNQPDRTLPGYNPNEEHALLAPSLRSAAIAPQPPAVYALRNGDLNMTNRDATYTSDPYVLVQFFDNVAQENRMAVYNIVTADSNLNLGTNSYNYTFTQQMTAGEPVVPFYPLPQVIGATPSASTYGRDGQPAQQICYWKDHKGGGWAVSGNSYFDVYYYYPLLPDFWWPAAGNKNPGDAVAFLPTTPGYAAPAFAINYTRNDQTPNAQGIHYTTLWPLDVPILKVGETLTFAGGEYQLDNPSTASFDDQGNLVQTPTPGLPGVVGFAAGQVVFDMMNPTMDDQLAFDHYTARIFPALEERLVSLPVAQFPTPLLPANGRSTVQSGIYIFNQLPSSLQKRIFYDPIRAVLGIKGYLNDKDISDSTLTASPPAVYCLEPNVLTTFEKNLLDGSDNKSPFTDLQGTPFAAAMDALFNYSRNPNQLDQGGNGADIAYRIGLEQKVKADPSTGLPLTTQTGTVITVKRDATKAEPMQALGPGLAMVANANFLDPANPVQISYVTVAENNSDALGSAPVALHIIKVDKTQRYRGSIKTILSANAFDENITLRHTADFGGNADDLVFEWWYRPEDGTDALPPDRQSSPSPWKLFADPSGNQGLGFSQLVLKGDPSAPQVLLGDTLFFLRYRHKNETVNGVNWEVTQPNGEQRDILGSYVNGIPYDWIGAGNSSPTTDYNVPGQPDYLPQLAEGWIKRVMTAVNPYETRITDFSQNAPAVYSSIIQQLGAAYTGPVALNSDPNVIQNVGLIQLYQTVLQRGEDLSINLSTPVCDNSIANALELAATRLSEFYLLLGNEAYSDSLDPAIGYGSDNLSSSGLVFGDMEPNILAFQNQLSTRLDEELGLLRGLAANNGSPVYNRLYWNFTHAEGEAVYVMKYNVTDANNDGVIDVKDAMTLYPQGHGDAWGHYLTAERMDYDLLRHPYFNWVSRSEYVNSQDVVIPVDYLDERNFAKIAAAKAQAGAEILNLTYRQKYVADPRSQWQGYLDTDKNQAWGVDEWARRAGQGALFDWVSANALLPAVHPNTNYTGIQKVDRTTVTDISAVAANFRAIQETMDQVDNGNNPLGLHKGALSFAVDLTQGSFFNQTYAKAVVALNNAAAQFNNANQYNNLIRQVANSQADFKNAVREQDLSYRNQLIEIFGTPYAGTIGSGKLYPAGYQGPDTALYNYVGVNNVNDSTVPQPSMAFLSSLQSQTGAGASIFQHQSFVDINSASWQQQFNLTILSGGAEAVNSTDFASGAVPTNQMLQNMQLPVMANGYSYVAPTEWGARASVGQLQKNIGDMVQAQADLDHEISVWQQISSDMINKLTYMNQKFQWDNTIDSLKIAKGSLDIVFDTAKGAAELAKTILDYVDSKETQAGIDAAEAVPKTLPTGGLAISPGDALAPVRAGFLLGTLVSSTLTEGADVAVQAVGLAADLGKAISDIAIDTQVDHITAKEELLNSLYEVQSLVKQEADQRIAVFKAVQSLKGAGDDYRTTLANGIRLVQERSNYNKKVAVQNQQAQYQDFTFRFSRNTALEQYRSAFDLASRYAYLAASAYDYDLNLGPDDSGSPLGIMADIIHQRSIGFVDGTGTPQVGGKGLAEELAKLNANYQVLSSRMGLLNPIQENETISLRASLFELGSETNDTAWFNKLSTYYVTNLWNVPEFRRYCRSFAPETNGPQPGLVIPFCSVIKSGQNFFNQPLGANPDVSYDPSVYSTRIASVAVGFNNYNGYINGANTPMSATPRVYMIPVGADVMTIPNDPNLKVRYWNVYDQKIPLPYPATSADFSNPDWRPFVDSVTGSSGTFGDIRQYSSFLANANNSYWYYINNYTNSPSFPSADQRLIGRSVWNTQWLLIIPGASLLNDPNAGIQAFMSTVDDIQLNISTTGYSGD